MDELAVKVIGSLMRVALAGASGWLIKKGWDDGTLATQAAGYIGVAATSIWAWAKNLKNHQELKAAVKAPSNPVKAAKM